MSGDVTVAGRDVRGCEGCEGSVAGTCVCVFLCVWGNHNSTGYDLRCSGNPSYVVLSKRSGWLFPVVRCYRYSSALHNCSDIDTKGH